MPLLKEGSLINIPTVKINSRFVKYKEDFKDDGLLPYFLYIASGSMPLDEYFLAIKSGDKFYSKRLSQKDDKLLIKFPTKNSRLQNYLYI